MLKWKWICSGADVDGSCRPWTEVVTHATPPHLVKVKINFDEAQKLTWKELKFLNGLIKIITPNHISDFWKCNLSREAEMFTPRGPVAGSFQYTHTVTTQLSIIVLFLVGSSTCSPHIDYSGQDQSSLEARSNKNRNTNPVSTKCSLKTRYKM